MPLFQLVSIESDRPPPRGGPIHSSYRSTDGDLHAVVVRTWRHALALRDGETEDHTRRVTRLTVRLARRLGIRGPALREIRWGAILHDIGKIGVPDCILHKPGALTLQEWTIMRRHPVHARQLLVSLGLPAGVIEIPHCHHERWDGTGYPRSLAGAEIPLSARAFAVADVYDALRSARPYRKAWGRERVLQYIRDHSGTHFDPAVVRAFLPTESREDSLVRRLERRESA